MATVQLRDIATDADREAVLGLHRAPGQERFLGSMASQHHGFVATGEIKWDEIVLRLDLEREAR